jgi:hypothetical protein
MHWFVVADTYFFVSFKGCGGGGGPAAGGSMGTGCSTYSVTCENYQEHGKKVKPTTQKR